MQPTSLPVYQHPATTVLIDDSRSYLDSVLFRLNSRLPCKAFEEADLALDWLRHAHRSYQTGLVDPLHVGYDEHTDIMERRRLYVDMAPILGVAECRGRFDLPAVVVVDYAMPWMNGLELCEAIRNLPCRKIMLTGHADEQVAIEAFNCGLIDAFISKNAPDAMQRLEAEIARQQRIFFSGWSATLRDVLTHHTFGFLSDPAIAELVAGLSRDFRFVEHYLYPNPEGLVFFDRQGKGTVMVIETKAGLYTQYELAQDQGAPAGLLDALRDCKWVPFFSDTQGRYLHEIHDRWKDYCLPAQVCQGRETYYWALFDLPAGRLGHPLYSLAEYLLDHARPPMQ